jgi:hypothetical protein
MRLVYVLGILYGLVIPAAAVADTWSIKEGVCSDWVGEWNMSETSSGVYTGKIRQYQIKEPCVQGIPWGRLTADVTATVVNGIFTAQKTSASSNDDCYYSGNLIGEQITGTYKCPNVSNTFYGFTINK